MHFILAVLYTCLCAYKLENLRHTNIHVYIHTCIFSRAFSWMKMFEFRLKFQWSLFLMVRLTIFQHWFRQWLGAVQATSHYLNQWWLVYRRIYASPGLNELRCTHAQEKTYKQQMIQETICDQCEVRTHHLQSEAAPGTWHMYSKHDNFQSQSI